MNRKIIWDPAAREAYYGIIRAYAKDHLQAAILVMERIRDATGGLATATSDPAGRVEGTQERRVPSLPYALAYEMIELPDGTEGVAILHLLPLTSD